MSDCAYPFYGQLILMLPETVLFLIGLPGRQVHLKERRMKKHIVTAVLIGVFATPALALTSGVYYVGLDMTTHTCSVVTHMTHGMKMMGKYKSKEAAEKAMAGMKKCHA
jgi:hypothetical protein